MFFPNSGNRNLSRRKIFNSESYKYILKKPRILLNDIYISQIIIYPEVARK